MIRIDKISIEEFRGIRKLDLDLGGSNFGICGPNGTGKSGVVDAIEFCLTGGITRLSGQGQGELNVKGHAPHVDQRDSPEKAKVTINAFIPSLNKSVAISRTVKNPRDMQLEPSDPAIENICEDVQSHPEFALSRREIAKYIVTPPAKRSEDVQNLLRLDQIGALRKSLRTYAGKCKQDADAAESNRNNAEGELKTALGLEDLDREAFLKKANEQRAILGLAALTELTPKTSFKDGAEAPSGGQEKAKFTKDVALADLTTLSGAIAAQDHADFEKNRGEAVIAINQLAEDAEAILLARTHGFITMGLELVSADACPLCDKPWEAEELRQHLNAKILGAEKIGALLNSLSANITEILGTFGNRHAAVQKAISYGVAMEPAVPHEQIKNYLELLNNAVFALTEFQTDPFKFQPMLEVLQDDWFGSNAQNREQLSNLIQAVTALPDGSANNKAIEFLAVLQDRYERLLSTTSIAKKTAARAAKSEAVYAHYNTQSNDVLEGIYDGVAKEFTEFYKAINDDEERFVGKLTAEPAKLSFNVDFYGRGTFPPGAYHSEGHQDGMGLCLYLALMKHTLGANFTFAVLDDVLMSVDTGHRREVCRLLKTQFPNTQFILTTHDKVWLQYMKTEGLIKKGQFFGGWNVDTGPRIWDDIDIWTEIDVSLDHDDVPRAAALLRRYLEYISTVLADNLRAQVEYRGDGNYDLGDLLPPVLNRWRNRLEKGIKSATSWGHDDEKAKLETMLADAKTLIQKSNGEQWPINKSVHFNEWENFTKAEFKEVATAFQELLEHIRCTNKKCGGFPYITPRKGKPAELRCNCGTVNVNQKLAKG